MAYGPKSAKRWFWQSDDGAPARNRRRDARGDPFVIEMGNAVEPMVWTQPRQLMEPGEEPLHQMGMSLLDPPPAIDEQGNIRHAWMNAGMLWVTDRAVMFHFQDGSDIHRLLYKDVVDVAYDEDTHALRFVTSGASDVPAISAHVMDGNRRKQSVNDQCVRVAIDAWQASRVERP